MPMIGHKCPKPLTYKEGVTMDELEKLCKCGHKKGDHSIEDPNGKPYLSHLYCMHNCPCQFYDRTL